MLDRVFGGKCEVMAFEIDDRLVPILADTLRNFFTNVTVGSIKTSSRWISTSISLSLKTRALITAGPSLLHHDSDPHALDRIQNPFQEFVVKMQKEQQWPHLSFNSTTKAYGIFCPLRGDAKVFLSCPAPSLCQHQRRLCHPLRWSVAWQWQSGDAFLLSVSKAKLCPPSQNSLERLD